MDTIRLVDTVVENFMKKDEKYGAYSALGCLKASTSIALQIMEKVIDAFDHKDPQEVMMHMRYAVKDCKLFIKSMEEKADVSD